MARKEQRRLYHYEGHFIKWITLEEEQVLWDREEVQPHYERRRDGAVQLLGVEFKPPWRSSKDSSPTTITLAEVQANVGITKDVPNASVLVADARRKVAAYPHVHDELAPGAIAGARWPAPNIEIVIVQ